MNIQDVEEILKNNYDIKDVNAIKKIKNVYFIESLDKKYCLKVIKYEYKHFYFILSAIKHLQNNGFENIPKIIKNNEGKEYIKFHKYYAYLTEWINARQCNYENPLDIFIATCKLAELHRKSQGFKVTNKMKPRIGWFKWIETFKTRKNEILDFKHRIDNKIKKTDFDYMYLKMMKEELNRSDKSILNLINSKYIEKNQKEIQNKGFCHHDYAQHNILIKGNATVYIIDFDYCILDIHLHDLASILIRKMKKGKWSMEDALFILDSYTKINRIEETDIPIMAAFMEFPQDYWQIGIQYYWEKQPWGEEFFIKKLKRIYDDREEKQEFINEFRNLKYSC